jgi:hypothetical protein
MVIAQQSSLAQYTYCQTITCAQGCLPCVIGAINAQCRTQQTVYRGLAGVFRAWPIFTYGRFAPRG